MISRSLIVRSIRSRVPFYTKPVPIKKKLVTAGLVDSLRRKINKVLEGGLQVGGSVRYRPDRVGTMRRMFQYNSDSIFNVSSAL